MAFLNPILLFGVLAVAVPIAIHLRNRRRVERVWWGAMRFLKAAVERNERRLRLEDLILLLLRCALVVLLALMLARPTLRESAAGVFGLSRVTAVIVVDVSGSMSGTDGVATRIDQARQAAGRLLETLPGGSRVALWTASDIVKPLITEPTSDLNLLRRTLGDLRPLDRGTNLLPAVSRAVAALRRQTDGRRELYLITDGQRQGLADADALSRLLLDAAPDIRTTFVLVGADTPDNLGVSDLTASSGISAVGRPLRYAATVTNYGQTDARDVRVLLRAGTHTDPKAPPVDETVIDLIAPGQSRTVSLYARLATPGMHSVRAEIPADRQPADDSRTLVTRAVERVRILIVDGNPGREPREAQSFFLRQALQPVSTGEASRWFVATEVIPASDLAAARLDDYDAVILAGVSDVSPGVADSLVPYLSRGGGLVVFPGPDTRPELLNRELLERRPLLPASLGAPTGDLTADRAALTLSSADLDHPIAAIWKDPNAGNPGSVGVYRHFPLRPADAPATAAGEPSPLQGAPRVVLRFSDTSPAVMERTYGRGRAVLFAVPATTAWAELPVRPAVFVPLLYRTLGAVVGRDDEQLNLPVGAPFVYRPPSDWIGREVQIFPPGLIPGDPARASTDVLRVELADGQPRLTYADTDLAGIYELRPGEGPSLLLATQPDASESQLARLGPAERDALARAGATFADYTGPESLAAVTRARAGTELWGLLAVIVLLVALTETGLAWWFSKPR